DALAQAGGSVPRWLVLISLKSQPVRNQRELAEAGGNRGGPLAHHLKSMGEGGPITPRGGPGHPRGPPWGRGPGGRGAPPPGRRGRLPADAHGGNRLRSAAAVRAVGRRRGAAGGAARPPGRQRDLNGPGRAPAARRRQAPAAAPIAVPRSRATVARSSSTSRV